MRAVSTLFLASLLAFNTSGCESGENGDIEYVSDSIRERVAAQRGPVRVLGYQDDDLSRICVGYLYNNVVVTAHHCLLTEGIDEVRITDINGVQVKSISTEDMNNYIVYGYDFSWIMLEETGTIDTCVREPEDSTLVIATLFSSNNSPFEVSGEVLALDLDDNISNESLMRIEGKFYPGESGTNFFDNEGCLIGVLAHSSNGLVSNEYRYYFTIPPINDIPLGISPSINQSDSVN